MARLVLQQVIKGLKTSYVIENIVTPVLYRAKDVHTGSHVAIKIPQEGPESLYDNEARAYRFSAIANSPYVRKLIEEIRDAENRCLVLEWMDSTLWDTRTEPLDAKLRVFRHVARSCLRGLVAFENIGAGPHCHADLNPRNVLVTGFSSSAPVIKFSDLGWTTSTTTAHGPGQAFQGWIQGPALRAPEVWRGAARSTAMDVWSVGVCLADWVGNKAHFGPGGCRIETDAGIETTQAAWSIAKLYKILNAPFADALKDDYDLAFGIAEDALQQNYVLDRDLRTQMEELRLPTDHIDFIERLLTVDPSKRPTAAQALALPFLDDNQDHTLEKGELQ